MLTPSKKVDNLASVNGALFSAAIINTFKPKSSKKITFVVLVIIFLSSYTPPILEVLPSGDLTIKIPSGIVLYNCRPEQEVMFSAKSSL